jgi:hypothetical protein
MYTAMGLSQTLALASLPTRPLRKSIDNLEGLSGGDLLIDPQKDEGETMKILLKTTMAGPEMTALAGSIIEVESDLARKLIDGGYAEAIEASKVEPQVIKEESEVEMAVLPTPEQALSPRGLARAKKGKK